MNLEEIKKTLDIFKSGQLVEVRSCGNKPKSGYFRKFDNLINCLKQNPSDTFYFVMNYIRDDCYSREQSEKILIKPKAATSDNDILRREWLLIDADPARVSGVSASNDEKAKAKEAVGKIYKYLRFIGFSEPVVADSGNGYHLLYKIDLKNTPENTGLVKKFLQALDMLFSTEEVKIDTSVFNASRITKLYGTMARKGTSTAERPHRLSRILKVPENISPTSIKLLQKVSAIIPEPDKPLNRSTYKAEKFDIDDFISKHGIRVSKVLSWSGGRKYILDECLFDSHHKAPDAAILALDSGAVAYHCFHNACQCYKWQDVRLQFEPDAYSKKEESRITKPLLAREPANSPNQTQQPDENHFLRLQDIKRVDRSKIVSVPSGFEMLDKKIIGFNKSELTIWSGGNGSGKSTILSQLALEAVNNGFKVAMFSGELTSERMKSWLHLQAAGRQFNKPTQYENVFYTPKDIGDRIDAWTGDKLWVYNNDYGMNANSVLTDIKNHVKKHQTDVVIIDNLMSLDMSSIGGDKYERQSMLVLKLADMAKKRNIHIHFVCHPRKPLGFLRKADISGTADLTNAADNVIMMHRVNNDFKINAKAFFSGDKTEKSKAEEYFKYSNVLEVMKNRDLGIEDEMIGLYFEPESKRMLNIPQENKNFNWYDSPFFYEVEIDDKDNPFLQTDC